MLKELLKGLFAEEKTERVGKVDMELADALKHNKKAHDQAHEEIEQKIKAFVEQMQKEHQPYCESFNAERAALWEKIYDQLNLTEKERGDRYTLDHVTGVVSRYVEDEPTIEETEERPIN